MTSVGSILNGAFRLFKEQPVAVAIWGALVIGYSLAISALAIGGISADFEALRTGAISPVSAIGMGLVFGALALLCAAVLSCAIYRAVLRPEEGGFAFLRVGADEFRMFGLYLIMIVAGIFVGVILMLFAMFAIGGSVLASGGGAGGFGFGMLIALALLVVGIYIAVRLSLIFPMTFVRRQISIDEGWSLSRGNFWTLFLAYLVIWIILIVLQMVLPQAPGQVSFFETISAMRDPDALQAAQARQLDTVASITFMSMLPYVLISSLVQVFSNVVTNAASATAVRELLRDQGEVLDDDINATAQIFE